MKRSLLLIALLAAAGAAAAQSAYRWVDKEGRVHYSDQPPPSGEVEEKRFSAARADLVPAYAIRKVAADFPVTLYTAETCEALCADARALLGNRGIPFTEKVIRTEADAEAYRQVFGTPNTVPAVTIGRQTAKGLSADRWNRMLDEVGYPKTPPPPQ